MKYIDAEKLKVLIQQLIGECIRNNWSTTEYCLRKILSVIDSLQQEQSEMGLEKEIIRVSKNEYFDFTDWKSIARHFFELGLKAKGE